MRARALLAISAALASAPAAGAAPLYGLARHTAKVGTRVQGTLGYGVAYIAWPTRIELSLARSDLAPQIAKRDDDRLVHVKTLRPDGGFIANKFSFVVPSVAGGTYLLAVWLRNDKWGSWRNAAAGFYTSPELRRRLMLRVVRR